MAMRTQLLELRGRQAGKMARAMCRQRTTVERRHLARQICRSLVAYVRLAPLARDERDAHVAARLDGGGR